MSWIRVGLDIAMAPFFSIIIPVSRWDALSQRSINSILAQTHHDFEIVCIDATADEPVDSNYYRGRSDQIRVIRCDETASLGRKRNIGIDASHGKYLLFLNQGSALNRNSLFKIRQAIAETNAQVVAFGFETIEMVDQASTKTEGESSDTRGVDIVETTCIPSAIDDLFNRFDSSCWTKCFDKRLIQANGLRFAETGSSEELSFSYAALALAESIEVIGESLIACPTAPTTVLANEKPADPSSIVDAYWTLHCSLKRNNRFEDARITFINSFLSTASSAFTNLSDEGAKWLLSRLQEDRFKSIGIFDLPLNAYQSLDDFYYVHGLFLGHCWREKHDALLSQEDTYTVTARRRTSTPVKVSVIIPIYNVESYLDDCIRSIAEQTLREIEIICVNDGSTDGSSEIVHQYARSDNRVIVIEQENMGLSMARNHGIAEASGTYVYLMDSDDTLEKDALEELTEFADSNNLDNVFFDANCFGNLEGVSPEAFGGGHYRRKGSYPSITSGMNLMGLMRRNREFSPSVGLQINRLQHLKHHSLTFHRGVIHEDNAFTILNMAFSERSGYLCKPFFNRRIRSGSIMTKRKSFDNAFGYYTAYIDVNKAIPKFAHAASNDIQPLIDSSLRMLKSAREVQATLQQDERLTFMALDPLDRYRYQADVNDPADWKHGLTERQKKLQKTYDEKRERGILIKELRRKTAELSASLTAANRKIEIQNNELDYRDKHLMRYTLRELKKRLLAFFNS